MRTQIVAIVVSVLFSALAPSSALAAEEFWDPNGTVVGTSVSGNWDLVTSNWTATIDSGISNAWTQGDDANFALAGTYTVTLTAPIMVGNLTATGTAGGLTLAGDAVNNLTLGPTSAFNVTNSSRTVTVSAPMVGTGSLTKSGNGTLTLSGANTYSGGTFLSSGNGLIGIAVNTVSGGGVITSSALGTGPITVNVAGHNIFASGAARILENPVTLNAGLTTSGSQNLTFRNGAWLVAGGTRIITVSNTALTTIESNLTDDGSARTLQKAGPRVLVLSGTNSSFLGSLTVNANGGTLRIGNNSALQVGSVVTVNSGGTLDLNGFNGTVIGLAGAGTNTLGAGTLTIANAGTSRNFTGVISGTGGLVVSNSISQQLEGLNTFSGGILIQAGTLFLRTNFALGDPITKAAGTGTITMVGTDPVVVNATAALGGNATTGVVFITNRVVLTSGKVLLFPSNGGTVIYTGDWSGAGGVQRQNDGSGPAALAGNNSFSGGVRLESRVLGLGHKNALGTGPFTIGNEITSPGNPITLVPITDLSGANAITNITTVNQNFYFFATNNIEFSGPMTLSNSATITTLGDSLVKISGNVGGTGALTKDGTNSLTLTGANTYEGSTTVSAGKLLVNNTSGSGTSTNSVTVLAGATLGGTGTIAGNVDVGGTLSPGASPGKLTITGNLNLSGSSLFELNRALSPSNDLVVVSGTLSAGGTLTVTNSGTNILVAGDSFTLFSQPASGFTTVNLPVGYTWNDQLAASGKITVVATTWPTTPTNVSASASGGSLTISWPANYAGGWVLETSPNLTNWTTVPGSRDVSSISFNIGPAPAAFYRLRLLTQ